MSLSYRLLVLVALYLAQGLPYGFFTQALPVLMREQGYSLKSISATSLLFLPWLLKFLWAPLVDHWGTRKGWIVPLQFATTLGAAALAFAEPDGSFTLIFAALLLFNLFAAMQDVATDGLAVVTLDAQSRGLGNGIQVGAYRLGMILGGGWLLWVFAKEGWQLMFLSMAGLLLLTSIPVLFMREPTGIAPPLRPSAGVLLLEWKTRLRLPGMVGFIGLICFYKFGDTMGASVIGPMLKDGGMSKEEIALLKGALGSVAGLTGAALGAGYAWRVGRRSALLYCGLLQSASLVLYAAYAFGFGGYPMLYAACIAEHLLGGMATVALFTLMMDAAAREHASTDYTLLACAIVLTMGLASFAGATVGDAFGYPPLFVLATLISTAGCLTLVRALDLGAGPALLRSVWPLRRGATLDAA
ncbi:MAG: MFS transporter [Nevskiales bacterium]